MHHPPSSSSKLPIPQHLDWSDVERSVYNYADAASTASASTRRALQVIEDAIQRYGMSALSVSFNGGKDCTVLLHLTVAALSRHISKKTPSISSTPTLKTFYAKQDNSFVEEELFVKETVQRYNLDLVDLDTALVRNALQTFLDASPNIRAIFVGTRRTDPHGGDLQHFTITDPGYVNPQVMRVHPIIDWSYEEIWSFLRDLNVPYCSIYDKGYTSLGYRDSTSPNPALKNSEQPCGYNPAWMLAETQREREGRRR